jgi:beta-glucosidase
MFLRILPAFLSCLILLLTVAACRELPAPETTATATAEPAQTISDVEPEPASDGRLLPYLDPALPAAQRADDLLARMTLAEKIGQMTLVERGSINTADIGPLAIGGLLSGGGGYPTPNTPAGWAEMVTRYQDEALSSRLAVPLIYGVDAVHGHSNVVGTVIFPHNVGLGAADDAELVERIGRVTAVEVAATGIFWNYAPVLAVARDIRWGRTYEAYGEQTELVTRLAAAYLRGQQNINGVPDLSHPLTVLATPKHYVGDGGTVWGSATTGEGMIDQGVTAVDEATLRAVHLPPYQAAVAAGARSIMVSFSSWNETRMHAHHYLLTDVLKGEMAFDGFLVSDWEAIDQISPDFYQAVVTAINAGIDMNMVPYDYRRFITTLTRAVDAGDVPLDRIDDAVHRILRVKFELGLFERPYADPALLSQVGSDEHRALARAAVRQSLVLLKNENGALPLDKETPVIYVAGEAANDLGIMSGGWTVEWQGHTGNRIPGTTILQAIQDTVAAGARVEYNRFGNFDNRRDDAGNRLMAEVGIVVVGERPYAEFRGDSNDLRLSDADLAAIARARESSKQLVVILISGRPLIISEQVGEWDALVAAWLPGSEGQGIADVLFGDYPFTGTLPLTWPRSMNQLPFDFERLAGGCDGPLFPFGYWIGVAADSVPVCWP